MAFALHCVGYFGALYYAREYIFITTWTLHPHMLPALLLLGASCCLLVFFNRFAKAALALIWLCFVVLLQGNFLLHELYFGYIGLLIAFLMLSPLSGFLRAEDVVFFKKIQWVLLFVLSLTQTVSGFSKILFPGWLDGEVFSMLINSYVVRPQFKMFFGDLPSGFGSLFTLPVLIIETSLLFLFVFPKLRKYSWLLGVILQFLIFASLQLSQISSFMIILYIFAFDVDWKFFRRPEFQSKKTLLKKSIDPFNCPKS